MRKFFTRHSWWVWMWVGGAVSGVWAEPSREVWTQSIPGSQGEPVSLFVSRDTVYALSGRAVTAFQSSDGSLVFQFTQPKGAPSVAMRYGHFQRLAALIPDGLVASRGDGSVMVWRKGKSPQVLWRSRLSGDRIQWPLVAVEGDRCVIVDPGWNGVIGVDLPTGEVLWERELASACSDVVMGSSYAALVTASETVAVASATGEPFAVWKLPPDHYALVHHESGLLAVGQGGAAAWMKGWEWMNHRGLRRDPLALDWSWWRQVSEWAELTPGALGNGVAVSASHGVPSVVALSLADGNTAWTYREAAVVYWSPPVTAEGCVLVSTGGEVRVLDARTGRLLETLAPAEAGASTGTWISPVAVEGSNIFAVWGGRVTKFHWRPTFDKSLTIPLQKGQP